MSNDVDSPVMKLRQAAAYIGSSPATLRRLVRDGRIKRLPYSRHILILRPELDRFLGLQPVNERGMSR